MPELEIIFLELVFVHQWILLRNSNLCVVVLHDVASIKESRSPLSRLTGLRVSELMVDAKTRKNGIKPVTHVPTPFKCRSYENVDSSRHERHPYSI